MKPKSISNAILLASCVVVAGCAEVQIAAIGGKALYEASPLSQSSRESARYKACHDAFWIRNATGTLKPKGPMNQLYCCTGTQSGDQCIGVEPLTQEQ